MDPADVQGDQGAEITNVAGDLFDQADAPFAKKKLGIHHVDFHVQSSLEQPDGQCGRERANIRGYFFLDSLLPGMIFCNEPLLCSRRD